MAISMTSSNYTKRNLGDDGKGIVNVVLWQRIGGDQIKTGSSI